jgi:hypothetical protein
MAITKRGDKGSALTYQEMDDNFDAITPRTSETGAAQIPAGTTGERPAGQEGQLRFNTASKQFEGFQGTTWTSVGAGGGGAGAPGAQGVQGPAGSGGSGDGLQGERGIQGADGIAIQGADGGPGIQGPAGSVQGLQGTDGNDGLGIQGSAGTPGQTGPQGTAGEDGDPGVQGPAGSIQGMQGFQGFQGTDGSFGGQGVQGPAGSVQGLQGTSGDLGDDGAQGFQGFQGPAGQSQGVQGIQGGDGPAGFGFQGIQGGGGQGVQGMQGNDGPAGFGLQGMQGLQGDEGPGGTGPQGVQGVQGNPSNVAGPQGIDGPEGPQGTQGTQAAQGIQGVQGADGVGETGAQGIQGIMVQGITGADGVQGLLGLQGIQGTVGVQGESVTGDDGIQGVQGLQGAVGENGFQGVQGPGIQGNDGVQGLAGEGNQGVQGFDAQGVQGMQGTQGTTLQGFQGTEGTPGFQGVQGVQAEAVQGVQGPFGIQGPSDGAQGPAGPPGIQGPSDGVQGLQGTAGDDGVGTQGTDGGQGIQGLQGPSDGPQGPQGIQGIGLQGTTGAGTQGVQGVIGTQGPSDGADGNQGVQGTSGLQGASGSYGGTEFPYSWNNSTLGGDPGAGRFAADAANLQFASVLYIDDADSASVDIQSYLRTTDDPAGNVKGHIRLSPAGTPNQYVLYSISAVTEETGFFEIGVVWEAGNRTSFTNQTDLIVSFERVGAIGTQGAQGITGAGVQGLIGLQGIQGMQGVQGLQGLSEAGTQGLQGVQGPEAQDPDVSADTSPQLGGNLDINSKKFLNANPISLVEDVANPSDISTDANIQINFEATDGSAYQTRATMYSQNNLLRITSHDRTNSPSLNYQQLTIRPTLNSSVLQLSSVVGGSATNYEVTTEYNAMTHIAQNMEYLSNPVRFNKIDTTARDALTSQAEGNMIYNTTTDQVEIYNGSGWENLITSVTGESTIDGDVTIDNRNRLRLADAGVDKALIGLNQGKYLYMGSEGTNSDPRIRFDGEATQAAIVPTLPAGATTSGASGYLNLGSTTSAFKEIHLTDGVVFGDAGSTGTSTSNTLDSYEEGTWTPTLNFGGGSTGIAYTTQSGSYVKIGQIVTVQFRIELSSKGTSTGDANFGGLPFTATSVGTLYPAFYGLHHDVNSGSGNTTASVLPIGQIGRANTTWKYYSADSVTPVTDAYFNNNTVINGTVTFRVD